MWSEVSRMLDVLFTAPGQDGTVPTPTLILAVAAMGMPLAGTISAVLMFSVNALIGSRDELRTASLIPLIISSITAVFAIAANGILTAMMAFRGDDISAHWFFMTLGVLWFAILCFLLPLLRMLISETRSASNRSSLSAPIAHILRRSSPSVRQLLLMAGVLALIILVPWLATLRRHGSVVWSPYFVSFALPTVLALIATIFFFWLTSYHQLTTVRQNESGVLLLIVSSSGQILFRKQDRSPIWQGRWILPRLEMETGMDTDAEGAARKLLIQVADELSVCMPELASAYSHCPIESDQKQLHEYFKDRDVLAKAKVRVFEIMPNEWVPNNTAMSRFASTKPLPDNFRWLAIEDVLKYKSVDSAESGVGLDSIEYELSRIPIHMKDLLSLVKSPKMQSIYWKRTGLVRTFSAGD